MPQEGRRRRLGVPSPFSDLSNDPFTTLNFDPSMAPAQPPVPLRAASSTGFDLPEGVVDWNTLTDEQRRGLTRGARIMLPQREGETFRQIATLSADMSAPSREDLPGDVIRQYDGFRTREGQIADVVGAVASGAAEQFPGLDEAVTGLDALINRRSFSESRDQYRDMVEALNEQQRGARNVGGLLGFGGTMLLPAIGGAKYVSQGVGRGAQVGRAMQVGGATGAVSGGLAAEGGAGDRLEGAGKGLLVGSAFGGYLQRAAPAAADLWAAMTRNAPARSGGLIADATGARVLNPGDEGYPTNALYDEASQTYVAPVENALTDYGAAAPEVVPNALSTGETGRKGALNDAFASASNYVESGLSSYVDDQITPTPQGQGIATQQLLDETARIPQFDQRMNATNYAQNVAARNLIRQETAAAGGGALRPDAERARALLAQGGVGALREYVKRFGLEGLPAWVGPLVVGGAVTMSQGDQDQQQVY